MFKGAMVLILLTQICVAEVVFANIKEIEPSFERFMVYFDAMYAQPQIVKEAENTKMSATIESVLGISGLSPVQKQKLLFKLGQIHLQRSNQLAAATTTRTALAPQMRRSLISAANALRRTLKIRGSRALANRATLQLALTLSRLGNDNANFYYRKLLKQNRNSSLIPYVRLAQAEHFFAARKYSTAQKYYKKAIAYHKHRVYPFAVYKIAWNYFHLRDKNKKYLPRSIKAFKAVVNITANSKHRQLQALHEDAVSNLAHVWSELKDINAAKKFFIARNKKATWHFTLHHTAQLYVAENRKEKAIAVYKTLLKATALLPAGPDHLQALLKLLYDTGKHHQLVSYIQNIPNYFAKKNSTWYLRNKDHQDTEQRLQELNESIWKYARHLYELGTDPRYEDARKHARTVIQVYLQTFPDSEHYLQARFLLAEILYEFNYLEHSAQHFLAISNRGDRDDPLIKLAASNAIKSMKKLLATGDEFTKSENNDLKIKYKKTIDNYLHLFPEDSEAGGLFLIAANMELELKNIRRAKRRLQTLLETFPENKEADQAVHTMLRLMTDSKNWRELITWVDRNRNLQPHLSGEANKMLSNAYRDANYYLAQQLQGEEAHRDAAVQFMHYHKLFHEDKLADDALFLAGKNYYLANETDAAIDSHNLLVDNYPQSEFVKEALLTLARTHERVGLFAAAAGYYHTFGVKFIKSKNNYRALTKAMRYYFYQGMLDEALQTSDYIRQKFTANLPQDFYATLAAIHIKAERYDDAWRIYRYLLDSPRLTAIKFDIDFFDTLYDNGYDDRLIYTIERLQSHVDSGEFRDVIAALRFKLLLKPLHEFLVMSIDHPLQVDEVVRVKQHRLLQLVSEFEKIIKIGDHVWQAASLYKLGEMHENFASLIFNAPKLVDATQQEIDEYRSRMEKAAFPLKNEAYKYYKAAWQKAQQENIFNHWMLKSYAKITSMYPDEHPQITEKVNTPLYLTHKMHLSDSTGILLR